MLKICLNAGFVFLILSFDLLTILPNIAKDLGGLQKPIRLISNSDKKAELKKGNKKNDNLKIEESETKEAQGEPEEEKEKFDPVQSYKLIAVYLFNKQPRALIKNLQTPEVGAAEYKVGDFLDELQTISVSKISLNPTIRVELLDEDGLNYLIKPSSESSNSGITSGTTRKTTTGSKSVPSYFSGETRKIKAKKTATDTADAPSLPSTETLPKQEVTQEANTKKDEVETSAKSNESQGNTQQPLQVNQKAVSSGTPTQAGSEQAPPKEGVSKPEAAKQTGTELGRDRPKNPFE